MTTRLLLLVGLAASLAALLVASAVDRLRRRHVC